MSSQAGAAVPYPSPEVVGYCSDSPQNGVRNLRSIPDDSPGTVTNARQSRVVHVACFIDSMDPGGAEEVVLNLAAGLPAHSFRTTVFHFGNPWITQQARARAIAHHVLDDRYYRSTLTLPLFARRFAWTLKAFQVDVLHCHLLGAILAGAIAAKWARIPSIGTIHDVYSLHESPWHPRYVRWAQRAGSRLIAVCDAMRQEVQKVCGVRSVGRIYNGVDLGRIPPRRAPAASGPIRITCVARAVPVKRHDLLLSAFAAVRRDIPAELHVVGDGPELPGLRRRAQELGVAARVVFHGHRDDVPQILADSHVYALVSDSEGMSVSILESMAAGLPAVVTDVGGNRELVEDGRTGWVVPRGDAAGITAALERLLLDPAARSRFGYDARERASRLFTIEKMCADYAVVLGEVTNRSQASER